MTKRGLSGGGFRSESPAEAISESSVGASDSPSVQPTTRCHARVDPVEQLGELLVVDERLGALAAGHLGELGPGEHRVEVERAGAELGRGQRRLDEAAMVATHDPDPVAVADPHPREGVGEGVGAPLQLLEGERAALVDQRGLVRMVDRRGRDAEGRRGAPAHEGGDDLRGLVGTVQADDAGLVQHLDLERFVRGRLPHRRSRSIRACPWARKPIRSPPKPRPCRRFPRRGRSSPCPRWWSP